MRKRTKLFLTLAIGLQLYYTPLIIAEQVAGIGSDEIGQDQTALVLDSLHTQEPPGIPAKVDTMVATYYSRFFHGNKTASGERFDRMDMTCAHKTLPFNTLLKVTNPKNNKSVIVRVNDRGPFKKGRQLDLSYAAAKEIEMIKAGVMKLQVEILPEDSLNTKLTEENSEAVE